MRYENATPSAIRPLIRFSILLGLAAAWWIGISPSLAQPPPKKLVKSCEKGDAEQCYWVGVNQSARNAAESRRYFSKACNGGYRKGCSELFEASQELMDGNAADQQEAIRHFEGACSRDHGRSCTALASALWAGTGGATDPARAVNLWQKGCDHRSRVGCRRAGSAFEKGTVVAKDLGRALAFYQKSCDLELESACGDAGRLLQAGVSPSQGSVGEAPTGPAAAVGPLRKACLEATVDKVRGDACLRLGHMLAQGEGVARDPELAFEAFTTGCRDNHRDSCVEAGRASAAGQGVARDDNAAMSFFGKACRLKATEGCEALCRMQCDAGQPYACDRLKKNKWPMEASCAMPPLGSNS